MLLLYIETSSPQKNAEILRPYLYNQGQRLNAGPGFKRGVLNGIKLDDNQLVTFKELLMANSIQVNALAQLFIEKGFITEEEFFDKLKQVQAKYQNKLP
jgi:hypothetical protein